MSTSSDYKLFANDIAAWPAVISMQNILGAGMPEITDSSLSAFMGWIDGMSLGGTYGNISNTQLKTWIDTVFANIVDYTTNYNNRKLPEVYLANMARVWIENSDCQDCLGSSEKYYIAFSSGADVIPDRYYSGDCSSWTIGPWGRPGKPDSWRAAIDSTFTTWGTAGVPSDLANVANLYSMSTWTNVSGLKSNLLPLWTSQASALSDLQDQTTLDDNSCIFLLYLLCSLATGDTTQQSAVQKIASVTTNSFELPNDNFIDTLIYYIMMLWVDPLGDYCFNSDQIKGSLNNLNGVLVSTDAGTQAIKTSARKYLKILTAVPTYPMTDPYNSSIGFNTRQSDILSAINSVWPCK